MELCAKDYDNICFQNVSTSEIMHDCNLKMKFQHTYYIMVNLVKAYVQQDSHTNPISKRLLIKIK